MEVNEYFGKLVAMVRKMESIELFADRSRLSRTEFRMLREIAAERANGKDIISSELARRLGVTRSAVSQLVTKMEQRGIVERVPSPVDKKIAYIRFSERSDSLYDEQCTAANRIIGLAVEELGTEKVDALIAANDEFLDALARARRTACGQEADGNSAKD